MPKDKKDNKLDVEDNIDTSSENITEEAENIGTPSYEELIDKNEELREVSFES